VRLPARLALLVLLPLAACGKKIGDECKTAFDCNEEDDTRTCDISQPGGYCTIDGCDERSCPDDSVCVRFFPRLYLTTACDPAAPTACATEELCVPDVNGNKCAPRASELRRCVRTCEEGGDCRDGYECRATGSLGSIALTPNPAAGARFCAPRLR
jgi:hypothetical protein